MKLPALALAAAVIAGGVSLQPKAAAAAVSPRSASPVWAEIAGRVQGAGKVPTLPPTPVPTPKPLPTATRPPNVKTPKGGPLQKGIGYIRQGDYPDAEAWLKKAVKQQPKNALAWGQLGFASIENRDFREAFTAFKVAVRLTPRDPRALYYTAIAGLYMGKYAEARSYADRLVALRPKYEPGYHIRFLLDGDLIDPKAQMRDARQIIKLLPRSVEGYNDLGTALANNGRPKEAVVAFSRAIRLQPKSWALYRNRALANGLARRVKAELSDIRKAIALAPDSRTRATLKRLLQNIIKASKKKTKSKNG